MADVADNDTARPGHLARSGPPHRVEFVSRSSSRRTHRPRHPPTLPVPRYLQPSTGQLRHLALGGLASPASHSPADAWRGQSFDPSIRLSPSARERVPAVPARASAGGIPTDTDVTTPRALMCSSCLCVRPVNASSCRCVTVSMLLLLRVCHYSHPIRPHLGVVCQVIR